MNDRIDWAALARELKIGERGERITQGARSNNERMPVLLTREEEFRTWLTGTPDEAFACSLPRLTRQDASPPTPHQHPLSVVGSERPFH